MLHSGKLGYCQEKAWKYEPLKIKKIAFHFICNPLIVKCFFSHFINKGSQLSNLKNFNHFMTIRATRLGNMTRNKENTH